MESIEFRDIPNYIGLYQINNIGILKSLDRIIINAGKKQLLKGSILRPGVDKKSGRKMYSLCKNGKKHNYAASRLVAITFIPNPLNLLQVDHINEDPSDDRVENLQWITQANNITKNYYIGKTRSSKQIKKIIQYTLDMEFVSEHNSITEAQRLFTPNSPKGSIACHLKNTNSKHAYGFIWKYK